MHNTNPPLVPFLSDEVMKPLMIVLLLVGKSLADQSSSSIYSPANQRLGKVQPEPELGALRFIM